MSFTAPLRFGRHLDALTDEQLAQQEEKLATQCERASRATALCVEALEKAMYRKRSLHLELDAVRKARRERCDG